MSRRQAEKAKKSPKESKFLKLTSDVAKENKPKEESSRG